MKRAPGRPERTLNRAPHPRARPVDRPGRARAPRGMALVSALLLVALATATAVYVTLRTSLRLRDAENAQGLSQAVATARGAIDFGRWVLREDEVQDKTNVDSLQEAWAQALPAFPVENGNVSGVVHDAQGLFNLNNVGINKQPPQEQGSVDIDQLILGRLLAQNHVDPTLANAVRDWVDADHQQMLPGGAEDLDYLGMTPARRAADQPMLDARELMRVKGFTPDMVDALLPFVVALPVHTPVNVNTAPVAVLAALFDLGGSDAQALAAERDASPFVSLEDLQKRAPPALARKLLAAPVAGAAPQPLFSKDWDVGSHFFQIDARATYGRVQYGLSALVKRDQANSYPTILWERRTLF